MFDDSEHFIDALRASLAQPMHCRRGDNPSPEICRFQDAAESLPGVDEPLVLPSPEEEDVELSLAVEVSFALVVELVLPPPEP